MINYEIITPRSNISLPFLVLHLGVFYFNSIDSCAKSTPNDRGSCEVDFIIDTGEQIIPWEVKAEVNLKTKSLKTYCEKFNPRLSVCTSMADYKKKDWLINLPLYGVEEICKCKEGM